MTVATLIWSIRAARIPRASELVEVGAFDTLEDGRARYRRLVDEAS